MAVKVVMKQTENPFPRLLLITEVPLSENSLGIDRTLVNLLEAYPKNKFMLYTCSSPTLTAPTFKQNVVSFSERAFPLLNNRIGNIINGLLSQINLQLMALLPIPNVGKIQAFAPELLLICPNSSAALLMGHKVVQCLNCPYLIYFMDNWVAKVHYHWIAGSIQAVTRGLLSQADGWLMISHRLRDDLEKRYNLSPSRSLVVHNPVDLATLPSPDFTVHHGTFKVVYAGSIWTMHYDAIAAIADAIFELRQVGYEIELILHTPPMFWQQYQTFWESRQVVCCGMVPHHDLQTYLQRADLLLVASSFTPEHAHVTRSSVQTKLTDYMASGRPILSCGPAYGACNDFVKQWNCGLVCDTNSTATIKSLLTQAMQNRDRNQVFAHTAFAVVERMFDKQQTSNQLFQFISESL